MCTDGSSSYYPRLLVSYTISKVPLANAKNKPTQTKKQNMVGKKNKLH
jgi:hypothetical protein